MIHSMKILKKIVENRIRSETLISEHQFSFMSGKSTTKPLFCVSKAIISEV